MSQNYAIKTETLENGLRVIVCHAPHNSFFEANMHVNVGARDEKEPHSGISHFLEHMMFRGSKNYPSSLSLSRALEALGGESNAMTSVESTSYWLRGDTTKSKLGLELFSEFFLNPLFNDIDIERKIILQELASDYNEEGSHIDVESLAFKALFKTHPLSYPVIGHEKSIKAITKDDLKDYYETHYTAKNCILTFLSPLSFEDSFASIRKSFSDFNSKSQSQYTRESFPGFNKQSLSKKSSDNYNFIFQNNPDNQFSVKFLFPFSPSNKKLLVGATFLSRVLDDGLSTRLPKLLREKHGLVYDVSTDCQILSDCGFFSVDCTVSKENLEKILEPVRQEISHLAKESLCDKEVEHIKFRYLFDLKQMTVTPEKVLYRQANLCCQGLYFSLEEEIEILKKLDAKFLLSLSKTIFRAEHSGCVLVGPRARKKRETFKSFFTNFKKILGSESL